MNERWKMNRIGFVNFWLYDEEDFEFEDGKLLLRGQNGSGKSITTQSFIPFVLDGDRTPADWIRLVPVTAGWNTIFGRRGQGGVYRLSVSGILERRLRRVPHHWNRTKGKTRKTDGFLGLCDPGRAQSGI